MTNRSALRLFAALFFVLAFVVQSRTYFGVEDSRELLTIDHYVQVRSTVPAIEGQNVQLYVRERVEAGTALRSTNPR